MIALAGFGAGAWWFSPRHADAQLLYAKYESVRQALIAGDTDAVRNRAVVLANAAAKEQAVAGSAAALAKANDLEAERHAFAVLSDAMIRYRATSTEQPRPVVVYCPMAKQSWLQPKGEISNPYFDASMRTCGEIKEQ